MKFTKKVPKGYDILEKIAKIKLTKYYSLYETNYFINFSQIFDENDKNLRIVWKKLK